jgi:hypothetical protein
MLKQGLQDSQYVKADLKQLAGNYAAASTAAITAEQARQDARDRLIKHAPLGYKFAGVCVHEVKTWRLRPEAAARLSHLRAELISQGLADLVTITTASRNGRRVASWQ